MEGFRVLDRELNERKFDGITVNLMWVPGTDQTYVTVFDEKENDYFQVIVPTPDLATQVFMHPYSFRGFADVTAQEVEHGLGTE